jgi:hypothetical protein
MTAGREEEVLPARGGDEPLQAVVAGSDTELLGREGRLDGGVIPPGDGTRGRGRRRPATLGLGRGGFN